MLDRALRFFTSLKLTVVALAVATVLVFAGTLAQVHMGLYQAQERYFKSFLVWWGPAHAGWQIPVFPGGYLVGGVMLIGLLTIFVRQFSRGWKRSGLILVHLGLVLLLAGQLLTDLLSVESAVRFAEGEARNYSEAFRETELALIDRSAPDSDLVVSLPEQRLAAGGEIRLPGTPLTLRVKRYWPNADLLRAPAPGSVESGATQGAGVGLQVVPKPAAAKLEERSAPVALVELQAGKTSSGSWLVALGLSQNFNLDQKPYSIELRSTRYYTPFSIQLLKTTHDVYPGTDIPKNFQSRVRLEHAGKGETREVDIFMNNPLRYEGLTFYQYQMGRDEVNQQRGTSVLQVVRNPGWLTPYVGCVLVGVGLTIQFLFHLIGFIRERKAPSPRGGSQPAPMEGPLTQWLPRIAFGLCAAWAVASLRLPPDKPDTLAVQAFGHLPVVSNGRFQPLDSLARNALLQLREKQRANFEPWKNWWHRPQILSASEWLLEVFMKPELADTRPVIRVDHPDVKGLMALPPEADAARGTDGKHYSWNQIQPKFAELQRETARASQLEARSRSPYDQAVLRLWQNAALYKRLKNTLSVVATNELEKAQAEFSARLASGQTAFRARAEGRPFDEALVQWLSEQFDTPLVVPALDAQTNRSDWSRMADALVRAVHGEGTNYALAAYARMSAGYRQGNVPGFNQAVADYLSRLSATYAPELKKAQREQRFNHFEPFYKAMVLYVLAGLLVLGFWVRPDRWDWWRRAAVGLAGVALVIHTAGLLYRMFIEGRPPVTNLYSSAIFIGWAAVVLGLVLERFWAKGVGLVSSAVVGFITLIIAHHLSLTGDTMEMMRAVLDTNFWLATHVVTITLGYAATFVAGFLAICYVLLGVFTTRLASPADAKPAAPMGDDLGRALGRMVYGITCFAALFSFIGTVLGGIWADQSWGRFWGWDPKENGALIIVLWTALMLHARWGGLVRDRGLMNMAIIGNIVTAWSWFGVNMLGIGLHSYGFMDSAFLALVAFVGSQLALLALGLVPKHRWRSFASLSASPPQSPAGTEASSTLAGG